MEKKPGALVMVVGGALMAVGSLLTWLTANLDLTAVAAAIKQQIGVDVSGVPGFANAQHSFSAAGTKGWEGKFALIAGIAVLALGIGVIVGTLGASLAAKIAFIGGGIGVLVAVEAMLTKSSGIQGATAGSSAQLATLGLKPTVFDNAFKVSVGIGLYMALAGGIVAIVGGIMLKGKDARAATMAAPVGAAPVSSSGWDTPTGGTAPPSAPSMPPPTPPTAGVTPEPPPPMGGTGGDGSR